MTTKIVYLIRLRKSEHATVRVGLSCESEDLSCTRSQELVSTSHKISDAIRSVAGQLNSLHSVSLI